MTDKLQTLIDTPQFDAGLIAGLVVLGILLLVASQRRARGAEDKVGLAGLGFTLAALAGITGWGPLPGARSVPGALVGGLALAAGLTAIAALLRSRWAVFVAAVPGALVVAGSLEGVETWVRVVVAATGALGGALAADFDAAHRRLALGPVLLSVTVAAVYVTVPDTEASRAALGAALPLVLLSVPLPRVTLGAAGAVSSICLVAWLGGQEGAARPGAVVGAAGAVGLFALEPLARRLHLTSGVRLRSDLLVAGYFVLVQCAIAFGASRVAGRQQDAVAALVRLVAVALVGFWLACTLPPDRGQRDADVTPARAPRPRGRAPS
jgi:hypothetical protein